MLSRRQVPDFVVAGMPRCGTTFFYHNLQRHPAVHLPWRKELNFLNLHRDRGDRWYAEQLAGWQPGQRVGDIEPGYFLDPEVPHLLGQDNENVKVILGVRDPVSWVISLHAHFQRLGDAVPPLCEFAARGWDRTQDGGILPYRFEADHLASLVQGWQNTFGDDLLIFDYRAFAQDRLHVLQAMESFLGLPPFFVDGNFDDLCINTSQGRTLPGMAQLSRAGGGPEQVSRLLPRPVLNRLRSLADQWLSPASTAVVEPTPELITTLASSQAWYESLFADGPLLLGHGRPFEPTLMEPELVS